MYINAFAILFISSVSPIVLSTAVQEDTENYRCAERPYRLTHGRAKTDRDCEQIWSIENNPIGRFWNNSAQCHSPCLTLAPGGIALDKCVNITLTVLCIKVYMAEYRTHFIGEVAEPSGRNYYGLVASLFLFLLTLGPLGLVYLRYRCH